MARGPKLTKKQEKLYKQTMLNELEITNGVVKDANDNLLISQPDIKIGWTNYHHKWYGWDEEYKIKTNKIKTKLLTAVEDTMYSLAMGGDRIMVKFIMERRGGMIPESKQEITTKEPIRFIIEKPE